MSAISQIEIYKPDGTLAVATTIADTSQRVRNIMAENYIQVDFVSPTYVDIPVGSTISYGGYRFTKTRRQTPTYNGAWQYSEQFDDADGFLRTRRIKYYGQDFQEMSFALTTTLEDFAALIVKDVNKEREGARHRQPWTVGTIDAALENSLKTISFNGDTLFDACTAIAQEFETEWYITKYYVSSEGGYEVVQLNFRKKEDGSEVAFESGSGKVLNAMNPQRGEDADYGTRFFVFGGTRNLTDDYKEVPAGSSVPNLYENRLHLPDNQAYIDARNGQIVDNLAHNEVLEQYVTFDDIYPKNRDTITGVDSQIVEDDQGNQYRQYTIQADNCPFAGKGDIIDTLGIKFETGELAGQEFEAKLETEQLPWNKRLIIVAQNLGTDGQVLYVPNEQIKPSVGDVFVLTGVKLPTSKIEDAEDELLAKAEDYAKQHSADTDVYECISNNVYCYENPTAQGYDIGTRVKLVNTDLFGANGRSSRVQGVVFSLTEPYKITWQVGDNTKYSRFGAVNTTLEEVIYSQRLGIIDNSLLNLIKSTDYQSPSDENIYTALAAYNHIYKKHDHKGRLIRPDVLCVPNGSPAEKGFSLDDNEIALYASSLGEYAETPGGGGTGDIYSLTITKNGSPWLSYDPSSAAVNTNLTIGWSDLTEDASHKFVSQTEKDTWNAKLTSIPIATSSVIGGFLYGDPIDTMLVMNDGYLAVDLVSLVATTQSIVDAAVADLTPKVQAIPYIVGPDSDATAGTWTGTYEGITALTEGLTIVYVAHVAGASTTTLNINGLGAKTCYWTGTSKMTTQYPAGTPILLTYHNNGWRRADANTTYSAGTKALFDAGTNTSNRVWSASVLASAVAPKEHEHDWTDITGAPAFITADALNGYATETYVGNQISALNLGTASQKNYTTSVAQNGTDLPTSDAVYSAIAAAVTSALHYRGISSVELTDGGTQTAVIGGASLVAQAGDVVIYNGLEFLWENNVWNKLGDDSSYALKTVQISAGTGLTGGGDLTTSRIIGLSTSTQTDIGKGVTAYGWGDHSSQGYLKSSDHKALTLKVGTATVQSDYTSLAAKTYTITKQHITDAIGNTTYAAYNANGYLPLSGGTLSGALTITAGGLAVQGGDLTAENNIWAVGNITAEGKIAAWGALAIPTTAPSAGLIESGEVYLYASSLGSYSETPGGGGTGDIYALTITKNGSAWLSYNPGVAAVSANLTIGWSDLTPDANHRFLTDTLISTWNGKQDAISDLSTIRTNAGHGNTAYGWGDHSQAGYLTSYTETDPVFSASAASGITSSNISTWNGKYTKPSTGIPKTDLASAVQTTLTNADTAYGWGNHASAGYLTSSSLDGYVNEIATGTGNYISGVSKSGKKLTFTYGTLPTTIAWGSVTGKPTTLSGYGITDAVSAVSSTTDNAIARFDGTAGQLQNSLVTIDDSGNIFFPIATSTTFSANAKIVLGNAWFGSNPTGGLAYGTRDGSTYTSQYCFEGTQFRPVSTSDNQINIGTTSYRWKNIYLAGTIGNGTYALTLPSKSGTIAVTSDLNSYLPLAGGTMSNTNLVTNLNAEYLGGYKKQHYVPATIHNPSNGVLVTTDIDATSNTMIYVRIEGNSYSTSRSPMFTIAQAYCYNRGTAFTGVSALNIGYIEPDVIYFLVKSGYVCLWWSQGSSATRGFLVTVCTTYPDANRVVNRVSSITNTALPEDETVTLSKSVVPARTIRGVDSTDNAIARFNGEAGEIQNSGVLIDDSDNLSLPLGSSSSFSANPKLIIGNAWLGTNTAGALSYGIISGSAYNSYFAFEGTGLRPANSASAGDNKLNIGTSTVRFKDAYFGGTINTAGADISDSLSIPTDAPSSTTSGKIYLYASSTGSYAVEPWYGFNQLISNGNMESTTGWGTVYSGYTRTVENNVLTLTITSATYRPQVRTALSVANGHWVYYTYTMKYTTSAAYSDVKTAFLYPTPLYIPTGNQKDADYYNWKKTSGIVKVNAAKTYLYIGRTAASSHTLAVGDTVQIKNVMVCDLTEMFGDENIPTVEQFEAMYPQDYYDYSPIE